MLRAGRVLCLLAGLVLVPLSTSAGMAAVAGASAPDGGGGAKGSPHSSGPPAPGRGGSGNDVPQEPAADDGTSASRNAARTRMRECGHQWSSMKKQGTAGTMTWREFSMSCLARK